MCVDSPHRVGVRPFLSSCTCTHGLLDLLCKYMYAIPCSLCIVGKDRYFCIQRKGRVPPVALPVRAVSWGENAPYCELYCDGLHTHLSMGVCVYRRALRC